MLTFLSCTYLSNFLNSRGEYVEDDHPLLRRRHLRHFHQDHIRVEHQEAQVEELTMRDTQQKHEIQCSKDWILPKLEMDSLLFNFLKSSLMWLHCIQEDGRTSLACVDKEPLNSGSSREGLPLRDEVIWGLITALWAILTEACEHSWRFAELKKKSQLQTFCSLRRGGGLY